MNANTKFFRREECDALFSRSLSNSTSHPIRKENGRRSEGMKESSLRQMLLKRIPGDFPLFLVT